MGHNSFIKSSITHLTGLESLSVVSILRCSHIWIGGGWEVSESCEGKEVLPVAVLLWRPPL